VKPVIALVGRPNVGKSTLFNRLTRSRDAIVHDVPGVTRDRHYGEGRLGSRPFIAIDTGGFEPRSPQGVFVEMARQAEQAIVEADAVVFVVDGRTGLTAAGYRGGRIPRARPGRAGGDLRRPWRGGS
jgi:GTP-binding protein